MQLCKVGVSRILKWISWGDFESPPYNSSFVEKVFSPSLSYNYFISKEETFPGLETSPPGNLYLLCYLYLQDQLGSALFLSLLINTSLYRLEHISISTAFSFPTTTTLSLSSSWWGQCPVYSALVIHTTNFFSYCSQVLVLKLQLFELAMHCSFLFSCSLYWV